MVNVRGPQVLGSNNATEAYPALCQLQASHRAQRVIEGELQPPLITRKHIVSLPWDNRYKDYVVNAGLYGVHQVGHIQTDSELISALVERWHQETHTFHLPVGEMTVTLQDVAVLLGLRVDGNALCGRTDLDWSAVVTNLLGRDVDPTTFRKKSKVAIKMSWLRNNFSTCPENADDNTVQQYARAYLLMLVGSVLFTDHSGDCISAIYLPLFEDFNEAGRYSWASGVLAFLYRELCGATDPKRKQFGGPVLLLQLWSWERFPMGRPRTRRNCEVPRLGVGDLERRPPLGQRWSFYREYAGHITCRFLESYRKEINDLNDGKVIWLPYEDKMHLLPPICSENPSLWRTTAPLIHFWIVEVYNPGRVSRQFNCYQAVPPSLGDTMDGLHKIMNGAGKNWVDTHHDHLQAWEDREDKCLVDQRPYDHSKHDEYIRWFSGASILYINSPQDVPNTDISVSTLYNHFLLLSLALLNSLYCSDICL